jgi:D-xylulose reductase
VGDLIVGMGKDVLGAFPITLVCTREINVKGSFRYVHGCYRGNLLIFRVDVDAADLLARRLVDAKKLITHRFTFNDSEKAFETFLDPSAKAIKIIISGVDT